MIIYNTYATDKFTLKKNINLEQTLLRARFVATQKKHTFVFAMTNKIKSRIKNIIGYKKFVNSANFWEKRYQSGGNSGTGSYNNLAEFKARVINKFVNDNSVNSVIEFGCGDGNQLKYFDFKNYTGIDVSPFILEKCKEEFAGDISKKFYTSKEYKPSKSDLALSLDVIYHLVEDEVYNSYMTDLVNSSSAYLIIYSSNDSNHKDNDLVPHVRHRTFTKWMEHNAKEFKLKKQIPNEFPYNGDGNITSLADFYIYSKL